MARRPLLMVLLATAVSLAAAAPAGGRIAGAPVSGLEGVPRFGHVFLIVGENTTYTHLNETNAPYLMGTLRPRSAWFTSYRAATHWSQANYIALTSGQFN